jgi:hypothetical protein
MVTVSTLFAFRIFFDWLRPITDEKPGSRSGDDHFVAATSMATKFHRAGLAVADF